MAAQLRAAEKQRLLIQRAKFINSKYLLPDHATIYCGDFRDSAILAKIPDGSVSLILLDPPYAMMGADTNIKATLHCGSGRKRIGIDINQATCEIARADIAASPSPA